MNLSEFQEIVKDRNPGVLRSIDSMLQSMESQRVGHNLATEQQQIDI